jgi:hypothetical protein
MATPYLYKVVSLAMRKLDPLSREGPKRAERTKVLEPAIYVSTRLLDAKNEALRSSVRELVFGYFHSHPRNDQREMESLLIALVESLPALRCVK